MQKIALFFATGFGAGFIPLIPGTWGSVVGLFVFFLLLKLPPLVFALTLLAWFAISIWSAGVAEDYFQKKDPGQVVVDEVIGMFATLLAIPFSWKIGIIGFVLFRVFDIWKPFPARWFQDHLKGGMGVVMDDLMAGVYANLVLRIILLKWTW